ncbi:MAG TPA: PEP-CTERM sorting domain-containing protein [Phycisphaerae bacterium]|nr:PEP-CTERM sorting domain-containing protein [Phycisphaerae bacterium]
MGTEATLSGAGALAFSTGGSFGYKDQLFVVEKRQPHGGLDIDRSGTYFGGDMYMAHLGRGAIYRIDPNGNRTLFADGLCLPEFWAGDLVFGPDGAMYVADGGNDTVWRITPEPGTLALLGGGAMALLMRRRRR